MKRFLMATAAAAFALSSPLAMAQPAPGNPPGQHDNHPNGAPPAQHDTHAANHPGPDVGNHDTTIDHNKTVINNGPRPGQPNAGGWEGHPAGPGPQIAAGHAWRRGERYTGSRQVVTNWSDYHVQRPPSGYEYVRDGNQLVLIAVASGVIASVLANWGY
jgi:Ni/Co efflux regulator RcnB